jgi:hypothetical protein
MKARLRNIRRWGATTIELWERMKYSQNKTYSQFFSVELKFGCFLFALSEMRKYGAENEV